MSRSLVGEEDSDLDVMIGVRGNWGGSVFISKEQRLLKNRKMMGFLLSRFFYWKRIV